MQAPGPFPHLPLPLVERGRAKLHGGGGDSERTRENRSNRAAHSASLGGSAATVSGNWQAQQAARAFAGLPVATAGIPLLLQVDPGKPVDDLRAQLSFEIVSEQEDGFVIVATEDVQLTDFLSKIRAFPARVKGSAVVASIHRLYDDPSQDDRLRRVLSDVLYEGWGTIDDDVIYVVDLGISGLGANEVPRVPTRGRRDTDETWARKEADWSAMRVAAYRQWDELKHTREGEVTEFVRFYSGSMLTVVDGDELAGSVPDSITIRVRITGRGLRDIVLNYPYLFEVVEPDDIELPQRIGAGGGATTAPMTLQPPLADAPTVCVIDSGIQEAHPLLAPGVDVNNSRCYLPDVSPASTGDSVRPGGHGTRVAGAVLHGEHVPRDGVHTLQCWVQNARVLDGDGALPVELFPPALLRAIVERYNSGPRSTRIFNHSINSIAPCRTRHMSAWAAEIDALSEQHDILFIQSAGNLPRSAAAPRPGVQEHLRAGRDYPDYLNESACRVANPAQSLQALTVGSVAYGASEDANWRTIASEPGHPSAFSRSGFGIWGAIKPEVVEYAGDYMRTKSEVPTVTTPAGASRCYPELVRSTMYPPGPAVDRDDVGTSYAAPKVARLAAALQDLLPNESCLLYRALVVQSARWPDWARAAGTEERLGNLHRIGYGVPDAERATTNTDHRVTLIACSDPNSEGVDLRIRAAECHLFQVPIPDVMRRPGSDHDVLIEVTLSYAAQPRRTRRNLRSYLSTWVDWKSSRLGEPMGAFQQRAMKELNDDGDEDLAAGISVPWMLHTNPKWGQIRGAKRSSGTVQKDWAVVKSHQLPEDFCLAVVGHKGWSHDPDSSARYALAVSFEVVGREVSIYGDVRLAVERLQVAVAVEDELEADV